MKSRTLGLYVGAMVDHTFDWEKWAPRIVASGYDTISVFLTTRYYGNMMPWPFVNGKYDYTKINPAYRAHFREACIACKKAGLKLHLCFVDQFHDDSEVGPNDNPHTPFALSTEALYSSWDGSKYTWLSWDPKKDPRYLKTPALTLAQYKPIGAFGNGMWRFVQMIANVLQQTGVSFSVKWANETFARMEGDKKVASRGDTDYCVIWMRSILQAAGLKFDLYFDFLVFQDGIGREHVNYDLMHKTGIQTKHHAKFEIHGIMNVADCLRFQLPNDQVKYSTDGDLHMTAKYSELGHSSLPDVDLKYDTAAPHPELKTVDQFLEFRFNKYKAFVK